MKKTISLLCSLAFLNMGAFAQGSVYVDQLASSKSGVVDIKQTGGAYISNYQRGTNGNVTINQTQYLHDPNTNGISVTQTESNNKAVIDQKGSLNGIELYQVGGNNKGNLATITQSGSENGISVNQQQGTVAYGNVLDIKQSGNNGNIVVGQVGLIGGNNAWLTQSSNNSDLRLFQVGSYNSATITQEGGAHNIAYLRQDNSTSATSLGNSAEILQRGSSNWFTVEFVGDDNHVFVEQIGNGNLISDAHNSFGLGKLVGNGNEVTAIQHGNNLTGVINIGSIQNSVIEVLSIPRS